MTLINTIKKNENILLIWNFVKSRYTLIIASVFCILIVVMNWGQPFWMVSLVVITFLYPVSKLLFFLIQKLFGLGDKSQPGIYSLIWFAVVLLCLYFYFIQAIRLWPVIWFVVFLAWMAWALQFKSRGLYLSGLSLASIILFFIVLFRLAQFEIFAFHYLQFRYRLYQYNQYVELHNKIWTFEPKTGVYLYRIDPKKSPVMKIRPEDDLFFHDEKSAAGSMDFPVPGKFLAAVSSNKMDPFSSPSLSVFRIAQDNSEDAIVSFFGQCRNVFFRRRQNGSISDPVFSGKIRFTDIPNVDLAGVSVRYFDEIIQKKMQIGLYYKKIRNFSYAFMTIEPAPVGYPMSPTLMKQLNQIFSP